MSKQDDYYKALVCAGQKCHGLFCEKCGDCFVCFTSATCLDGTPHRWFEPDNDDEPEMLRKVS